MNIIIDERLRGLRTERGNTQEELATHIGVSIQAVSKWERGETMPDITFLPQIASYYDVSVDELLGVGDIRKQEKLKAYIEKSHALLKNALVEENLALWREAQHEFPNETEVMYYLMHALGNVEGDSIHEKIELGRKILEKSTCQRHRDGAIQCLCLNYSRLGDKETAKKYAEMAGGLWTSSEVLLEHVLEGDEFTEHCRTMFVEYLNLLYVSVMTLIQRSDHERQIKLCEWYIKLLEAYFDDGFYGSYALYAADLHTHLARHYICLKNDEGKAREHLEAANDFALRYDSLPEKYTYGCTLLEDYESTVKRGSNQRSASEDMLVEINDGYFERLQGKEWFKELEESLRERIEK